MKVIEAIKNRRSVRIFQNKKIAKKDIEYLIDAAQWAPCACNKQLWEFIAVDDKEILKRIVKDAGGVPFIMKAPLAIFVLYPKEINKREFANIQSAAAATENLLLAAYEKGIGSVWMSEFGDFKKIRKILNIPPKFYVVNLILLGYAKEKPIAPKRRDVKDLMHYNVFKTKAEKYGNVSPESWSMKNWVDYREYGIRATSPFEYAHKPAFEKELKKEVEFALQYIKSSDKVLDVFPFAGAYTAELLKKMDKINILEVSPQVTDFMHKRIKEMNINKKIGFSFSTPEKFPYKSESFDIITCFKKLETVPNKERFLKEIKRVLKKEGLFILSFWNLFSIYGANYVYKTKIKGNKGLLNNESPIKPLMLKRVKRLLKNDFEIVDEKGINLLPHMQDMSTKMFKGVCRTRILVCRKK